MSDVEHTYVDTNGGLGGPALDILIILMVLMLSLKWNMKN